MLMHRSTRKHLPLIDGPPIAFTHQEGLHFWQNGKFNVDLLYRKMVEKALIVVLRHSDEPYTENLARYKLRDYSVKKAPRRFWGSHALGYHIIRLHYGYGESERKIALRYVRSSEQSFDGHLFNHPPRRPRAR